jgi:hypothetical protein
MGGELSGDHPSPDVWEWKMLIFCQISENGDQQQYDNDGHHENRHRISSMCFSAGSFAEKEEEIDEKAEQHQPQHTCLRFVRRRFADACIFV